LAPHVSELLAHARLPLDGAQTHLGSFRPIPRNAAPAPVKASVEFTTACPDSAIVMQLDL